MQVKIFGRTDCPRCHKARQKLSTFFAEKNLSTQIKVSFFDVETPEGLAEGMWHEIGSALPVVIIHREVNDAYNLGPAFANVFDFTDRQDRAN